MNLSVDLILIVVNLLALAYSYGRFSEKITSIEKRLDTIAVALGNLDGHYYTIKEGAKLEQQIDAAWKKIDSQERLLSGIKNEILISLSEHTNGCNGYQKK